MTLINWSLSSHVWTRFCMASRSSSSSTLSWSSWVTAQKKAITITFSWFQKQTYVSSMDPQLQIYFLEHSLPSNFLLVNESQVLPSWTKDSNKELPDTLRNLGSPFEVGVDGAIIFSGWGSRQRNDSSASSTSIYMLAPGTPHADNTVQRGTHHWDKSDQPVTLTSGVVNLTSKDYNNNYCHYIRCVCFRRAKNNCYSCALTKEPSLHHRYSTNKFRLSGIAVRSGSK